VRLLSSSLGEKPQLQTMERSYEEAVKWSLRPPFSPSPRPQSVLRGTARFYEQTPQATTLSSSSSFAAINSNPGTEKRSKEGLSSLAAFLLLNSQLA